MFKRFLLGRNLNCLFVGQIVSQMGDSVYQIGLMWLVLDMTGSKSAMGTVAMISNLPILLFGLFSGILVDLFDKRKLMLLSDFLRALVVLLIPLTLIMETINLPIIMAISFAVATLSTVFNPARDSLVPSLVDKGNLLKANALIQASNNSAIFLGPAIGAAVIGIVGVTHLFTFDALTFLVSMGAIFLIRVRSQKPLPSSEESPLLRGHFSEILRYVRSKPRLQFLLILTAFNNFFIMGPAIVGVPIVIKEVLHEGATSYALVESSLGLGMIAGSFLVHYMGRRWNVGRIWLLGMIYDGITHTLVYFVSSLEVFMALIAFHALGIPAIMASRTILIQQGMEPKMYGRVFSLVNMSVVGMTALTTAITGWISDWIHIQTIFGIFGTMAMLCGVVGWLFSDLKDQ